jgi:hypothetical protein
MAQVRGTQLVKLGLEAYSGAAFGGSNTYQNVYGPQNENNPSRRSFIPHKTPDVANAHSLSHRLCTRC